MVWRQHQLLKHIYRKYADIMKITNLAPNLELKSNYNSRYSVSDHTPEFKTMFNRKSFYLQLYKNKNMSLQSM